MSGGPSVAPPLPGFGLGLRQRGMASPCALVLLGGQT